MHFSRKSLHTEDALLLVKEDGWGIRNRWGGKLFVVVGKKGKEKTVFCVAFVTQGGGEFFYCFLSEIILSLKKKINGRLYFVLLLFSVLENFIGLSRQRERKREERAKDWIFFFSIRKK